MSFCKFSPSYVSNGKTLVDNAFINDFLPKAPDVCVKVYLLGLNKCSEEENNTLEYFARVLDISEEDVISCFKYWESLGLVQVLSTQPTEVRYMPLVSAGGTIKKFKEGKYTDFNIQAQELFGKRMIMPNEFSDFYYLIENKHFEIDALLTLIKYCVDSKGFNLSPKYVLTVARDWELDGVHTREQVEAKIAELGLFDDNVTQILLAIGSKRRVDLDDKKLVKKWLNDYGFELTTIIYVAKYLKAKRHRIDFFTLDEALTKYYENKLLSVKEIEVYEQDKDTLISLAKEINKQLGLYYENLNKEIDTYILPWITMGFDSETLLLIADNCFKSSVRTLEGVNAIIGKLFKLGIVTKSGYLTYLNDIVAQDSLIKQVIDALNLNRNVVAMDRNFYRTWTGDWHFSHEIILYAASLSVNKSNAMQYLNKILSNWQANHIDTLEKAKANSNEPSQDTFIHNNYTDEQIKSLISNLDEVEV